MSKNFDISNENKILEINLKQLLKSLERSLFHAIQMGHIIAVENILKIGVDINCRGPAKNTPLSWAVEYNKPQIVHFLLEMEADPNIPDESGSTPLSLAARANKVDMVKMLLKNGAEDHPNKYGDTALAWAEHRGHTEVTNLLHQNLTPLTPASPKLLPPTPKRLLLEACTSDKSPVKTIG